MRWLQRSSATPFFGLLLCVAIINPHSVGLLSYAAVLLRDSDDITSFMLDILNTRLGFCAGHVVAVMSGMSVRRLS